MLRPDHGGTTVRARSGYCDAKPVDLLAGRRLGVGRKVPLAHHADELLVDVLPLAHPVVRQEVIAAEPVHLAAGAARAGVLPETPQLEIAREVAALLKLPLGTVKSRTRLALEKMRSELSGCKNKSRE